MAAGRTVHGSTGWRVTRQRLVVLATWLVALFLLWRVLRTVPLTAVFLSLQQLKLWQMGVLVLLNALVLVLLTGRWWLILWGLNHKLPFGLTLGHRLAAFGVSYLTPGPQFGGEAVQVVLVEKGHSVARTTAVSSVALDKTLELLVNFSFLVLGVVVILQTRFGNSRLGWQTAVLALTLLSFPVLYLVALWRGRQPIAGFMRVVLPVLNGRLAWQKTFASAAQGMAVSEQQAGQFCHQAPVYLWAAFLVSVVGWLVMVVEFGAMLMFLGAKTSFGQTIVVLTAVRFAFLLPLPGGLGTVEAALVLALTRLGFDPAVGISASLLIRGRDVLLAFVGLGWTNHFLSRFVQQASQKEVSDDKCT
jgi:uncharacterized protein (TIRG00374 family)